MASPPLAPIKLASGAGNTFGVDDIAIAWAWSGGFWKNEGLDVSWVPKRGGVRTAEAVLAGEVVAGYGTWVPVAKLRGEGKPIRILTSMAQALAQNLLVNKERITKPEDLRGKRWAVDGIGALSHTLARCIVRGLGISDTDIVWVESGPPPQRIAALLDGSVDCSLVRVEEATVLAREHAGTLSNLLDFDKILALAPVQPHGVLQVTDSFCREQPELCQKLVRGLMLASRDLHTNKKSFRQAVYNHVHGGTLRPTDAPPVDVTDEECERIWQREVEAGSFAINGGMTQRHWRHEMDMYTQLNAGDKGCAIPIGELCCKRYVAEVLADVGVFAASHDQPSQNPSEAVILGMGNPLLDISDNVTEELLAKYGLEANNAILAEEKHAALYSELAQQPNVQYIAGGATQNSVRVAQWMLQEPGQTAYMGCVGKDEYSMKMKEAMQQDGVNALYMVDTNTPTGTCAVCVTGNSRSLVANLAAANNFKESHVHLPENLEVVANAAVIYSAGFFATVSPASMKFAWEMAAKTGAIYCVNLAAPFLMQVPPFKAVLVDAIPYTDYLFGNETEALTWAETEGWETKDVSFIATRLSLVASAKGVHRHVVITQGAEQTIVAHKGHITTYPIVKLDKAKIADTNGAGDAYVGGFLAGLAKRKGVADCHKAGAYAACEIIQQSGCACPGKPKFDW